MAVVTVNSVADQVEQSHEKSLAELFREQRRPRSEDGQLQAEGEPSQLWSGGKRTFSLQSVAANHDVLTRLKRTACERRCEITVGRRGW